jgi:chromosome segregation ATPase
MANGKPLWRQAFDAVERRVAGPTESAVRSDVFNDAVALTFRVQRRVRREVERRSRRALHSVNLPAASDIKRVSEQVATLERQVRSLQRELESGDKQPPRAPAKRPAAKRTPRSKARS